MADQARLTFEDLTREEEQLLHGFLSDLFGRSTWEESLARLDQTTALSDVTIALSDAELGLLTMFDIKRSQFRVTFRDGPIAVRL